MTEFIAFEGIFGCEQLHSLNRSKGVAVTPSHEMASDLQRTNTMRLQEKLAIAPSSRSDMAKSDLASLMSWPMIVARTVPLADRRARLRLESIVWNGLDEISQKEKRPVHDLCNEVDAQRPSGMPLTSAIRSYVLDYFRQAEAV